MLILTPFSQCLSAQCIYCQSVRAKNTSRQRAHLMECQPYLDAMKEHNPQSSILELANNPQPTPPKNPKKRDFDAVVNGFQGSDLGGMGRSVPKPKCVCFLFPYCFPGPPLLRHAPSLGRHPSPSTGFTH